MVTGEIPDVNVAPLRAEPAREQLFVVQGRAVRIEGSETRGLQRIAVASRAPLEDLQTNLSVARQIQVYPTHTERLGNWGSERILAPARLPLAIVQWQLASAQPLQLSWAEQLSAGARPVYHTSEEVEWHDEAVGAGRRVTLRVDLPAGQKFLLAVSTDDANVAATAMARTRAADWQRLTESSPMLEINRKPSPSWLLALHEQSADAQSLMRDELTNRIGLRPDPERERVVLRPIVKPEDEQVAMRRMDLGGAWLDLEWTYAQGRVCFALELSYGNLTPRVIFEPWVPGPVRSIQIDGQPASLDLQPENGGTRCPMQLVLDHRREVTLELQ